MVSIIEPTLSIAGVACTSSPPAAFLLPTAFSGLGIEYGAESCADHPDAATMAGRVFIPSHHAGFYPTLATLAKCRADINNYPQYLFNGLIDELTLEEVTGHELPALIPNTRNMVDTAGWVLSYGAAPGANPLTGAVVAGNRFTATPPKPAEGDFGQYAYLRTPAAPVAAGTAYRFTAAVLAPLGPPTASVEWLDAAGAVLWNQQLYPNYGSSWQGEWTAIYSDPVWAIEGAVTARFTVAIQLYPAGGGQSNTVGIDGVLLSPLRRGQEYTPGIIRPPGRYYRFKASDITATAGRLMVGSLPWPSETVAERTSHLNAMVPAGSVSFGFGDYQDTLLGARDVDKQSSLEIYQRITASNGDVAAASPLWDRSVVPLDKPRYRRVVDVSGPAAAVVDDPSIAVLPASAITAAPLQTSVTDMSNQVRVEYRAVVSYTEADDATVSFDNPASIAAYGPMARSIATDLAAPAGPATDRAARLAAAQGAPFYRLTEALQLVTKQIPDAVQIGDLFSPDRGFGQLVRIDGAPAILGAYHRVRGASAVLGAAPSLVLDVEPENHAGPAPITFLDTSRSPYDTGLTFGRAAAVTFGQLATASRKDYA